VETVIDPTAQDGYRFEVRNGALAKADEERLKKGTIGRSDGGTCIVTGAPMPFSYIRNEGQTTGLGVRLMAVVVDGNRSRVYVSPTNEQVKVAEQAVPAWEPEGDLPHNPRDFKTPNYGLRTFASLFTRRQLVALTTFSDLVADARTNVLAAARAAGLPDDPTPLSVDGRGTVAYADAVATYLAFAVSKSSTRSCAMAIWETGMGRLAGALARQALPMPWSFAETNPLAGAGGDIAGTAVSVAENLSNLGMGAIGTIRNLAAQTNSYAASPVVISTDPPYYDNIGYADLSDFFYVWLRRSLSIAWPDLFRRLTTPKDQELVATPYRHGGREQAEEFFMKGMGDALEAIRKAAVEDTPVAIFYAFKQSEASSGGVTSAGWASFLQAVVDSGLGIDGTWPIRTEATNALKAEMNALASSIVLVCRKRAVDATIVTRNEFLRELRRELPDAIDNIRKAGVGPVDMQQSVIGPGMGVFTRYARVLEDDDSVMSVKTALVLINRVWEEIENELDAAFDPATQVALAWFATYGFDAKPSGELITLANAKNIPLEALFSSGVFQNLHGRAGLIPRTELTASWTSATDKQPTVWECVQHTARVLAAADGGAEAAAALVGQMGRMAADARTLAYRLFEIATKKSWAAEALVYNELAEEWPHLEDLAPNAAARGGASAQADMFQELQ
jgi:putative DNA methylase